MTDKLAPPTRAVFRFWWLVTVRWGDMDAVGHVNNIDRRSRNTEERSAVRWFGRSVVRWVGSTAVQSNYRTVAPPNGCPSDQSSYRTAELPKGRTPERFLVP